MLSRVLPVVFILTLAALACNLPAARPPAPAPAETVPIPAESLGPESALPPERSERLAVLVEQVSAERLIGHVEALAAIPTRHVNSASIGDAAAYVHAAFAAAGERLTVEYDPFPLAFDGIPTTQVNIVATLPGRNPAAGIVLVGAHYDSRTIDIHDFASPAPGADDNATGVAVLLELARLLAAADPLEVTVVLVAFSAEEVGVQGSQHYVGAALARGDGLRAALVLDIVGNAAGPEGEGAIRAFSAGPDGSPSRQLARSVDWQAQVYLPAFDVAVQPAADRPGRYSDHVPFSEAGVPAMRLIEAVENGATQHTSLDLPGDISPGYLRQAAQLALAAVTNLAGGPPTPGAPALEAGALAWQPVEGAVGYLVALRQPDSPAFERVIRVGSSPHLPLDALGGRAGMRVSVAAVGSGGLVSAFSPEAVLRN